MIMTVSVKHEMYARSLIIHKGNQTKAYLEVYKNCSNTSAPSKASRMVRNGNIIGRIDELLNGDTHLREQAYKQISKGLDAMKYIRCKGKVVRVPDNRLRMKAINWALKLLGDL